MLKSFSTGSLERRCTSHDADYSPAVFTMYRAEVGSPGGLGDHRRQDFHRVKDLQTMEVSSDRGINFRDLPLFHRTV